MTAEQKLAEARKAWAEKVAAEAQLSRLGRYARLTSGMKDDRNRYSAALHKASDTLSRVLGGVQ